MAFGVKLGRKGRTLREQVVWELKTMALIAGVSIVALIGFALLCAVFQ